MIVAERFLTLESQNGNVEVAVKISVPTLQGTEWRCNYEIDWPERRRLGFAAGLDSMQAIHLALQRIGLDIYMSDYNASGSIYWQTPKSGYGFPVPKNGRDFLIGEDKIYEG